MPTHYSTDVLAHLSRELHEETNNPISLKRIAGSLYQFGKNWYGSVGCLWPLTNGRVGESESERGINALHTLAKAQKPNSPC